MHDFEKNYKNLGPPQCFYRASRCAYSLHNISLATAQTAYCACYIHKKRFLICALPAVKEGLEPQKMSLLIMYKLYILIIIYIPMQNAIICSRMKNRLILLIETQFHFAVGSTIRSKDSVESEKI